MNVRMVIPGLLAAVVGLAPLLVYHEIWDFENLPKTAFIQLSAAVLLFIWLAACARKDTPELRSCALYVPLLLFLLWTFASVWWSTDRYGAFQTWAHWCFCSAVFLVALQVLEDRRHLRIILAAVLFSGGVIAALGIIQYLFEVTWIKQQIVPAATFNNKNMAAQFTVLVIPVALGFLLGCNSRWRVVSATGVLALLLTFLGYTFSRAAWIATFVEIAFLLGLASYQFIRLHQPLAHHRWKLAGVFVAIAIAAIMLNLTHRGWRWKADDALVHATGFMTASASDDKESNGRNKRRSIETVAVRLLLWRNTLEIIRDHPVTGVGLTNFQVHYPASTFEGTTDPGMRLNRTPAYAHNDFLQIFAEGGVVATVLVVWVVALLLLNLARLFATTIAPEDRLLGGTCMAAIAGLAVNALFSFPIYRAIPPLMLAVYAAGATRSAAGFVSLSRDANRPRIILPRWVPVAGAALCALVTVAWAVQQVRWFAADRAYKNQRFALTQARDWDEVIRWGKRVLATNSHRTDAKLFLGRAYLRTGDPDAALPWLEAARSVYPHWPTVLLSLGDCYRELGGYEKAEEALTHAIAILPNEGELYGSLGRVYRATGRHEEALRHFRQAVRFMPRNRFYRFQMGNAAYSVGLYQEAAQAYRRAARAQNPWAPMAHRNLGLILMQHLENPEKGVEYLKAALRLKPNLSDAAYLRSIIAQFERSTASNSEVDP